MAKVEAKTAQATLQANSALSGFSERFGNTRASEVCDLVMLGIAVPKGGLTSLNRQLGKQWQLSFPETGQCVVNSDTVRENGFTQLALLGLQTNQCLLVAEPDTDSRQLATHEHVMRIRQSLGELAYLTDQSDQYAVLDITGPEVIPALERLCSLDMTTLKPGMTTRTLMEHLQVVIQSPSADHVRLFAQRSFAGSFLHAITTSLRNVTTSRTADGAHE